MSVNLFFSFFSRYPYNKKNAHWYFADIDECEVIADICGIAGTCTNVGGSYQCTCPPGHTGGDQTTTPCVGK